MFEKALKQVKRLTMLISSIAGQTSGLYWSNLLSNILYSPNVANLRFWKIWPRFTSYVRQLHYKTEKMKVWGIRGVLLASATVTRPKKDPLAVVNLDNRKCPYALVSHFTLPPSLRDVIYEWSLTWSRTGYFLLCAQCFSKSPTETGSS